MADISKVVTVVDAQTFGSDFMTWDMAQNREGWTDPNDACSANQKVSELLAEQVEAADIILVNKVDLATEEQVVVASKVAAALNVNAVLRTVTMGQILPEEILGLTLEQEEEPCADPACTDASHNHVAAEAACVEGTDCANPTHGHSHTGHEHAATATDCSDPVCTDASHNHAAAEAACVATDCTNPSHGHSSAAVADCSDPTCTDTSHNHATAEAACAETDCTNPTHGHSHGHDHAAADCAEPGCTDPSHNHAEVACAEPGCIDPSHNHAEVACAEPGCTDTSHGHSHSHSHATSTDALGITNFVYKSDKPFDTQRLLAVLNRWPVPKKDILDLEFLKEVRAEGSVDVFGKSLADNPFVGVLRSKGFSWLAPSSWTGLIEDTWRHDTAMYLSHAGRHMSIDTAGKWWASIPQEQMEFFFDEDNKVEKERILREDFVSEEFGDRRQELVFIGMGIDQEAITNALNECLLTDEEMQTYRQQLSNIEQMMLSAQTSSVGLLDTEGTQHIDQVA